MPPCFLDHPFGDLVRWRAGVCVHTCSGRIWIATIGGMHKTPCNKRYMSVYCLDAVAFFSKPTMGIFLRKVLRWVSFTCQRSLVFLVTVASFSKRLEHFPTQVLLIGYVAFLSKQNRSIHWRKVFLISSVAFFSKQTMCLNLRFVCAGFFTVLYMIVLNWLS